MTYSDPEETKSSRVDISEVHDSAATTTITQSRSRNTNLETHA